MPAKAKPVGREKKSMAHPISRFQPQAFWGSPQNILFELKLGTVQLWEGGAIIGQSGVVPS